MRRLRALCILSNLRHPMQGERVAMLRRAGFDVEAQAFERGGFAGGSVPDCPVESLGEIRNRAYASRAVKLLTSVRKARAAIRRNDVVYAFGPDLGAMALLAGAGLGKPMAMEIADIQPIQVGRGPVSRLIRFADKAAAKRSRLLTLTADGYKNYYRDWLGAKTPSITIENKMDAEFAAMARNGRGAESQDGADTDADADAPIRVGWFGMLRDEWTLRTLECLQANESRRFNVDMSGKIGSAMRDFRRRADAMPNARYSGEFDWPSGVAALYRRADIAMVCYPPEIPFGWCRSNRLYQACLFHTPIAVRAGTADAELVAERDIGLIIPESDPAAAAERIAGIRRSDLRRWRANMASLSDSLYANADSDDDAQRLGAALAGLVG